MIFDRKKKKKMLADLSFLFFPALGTRAASIGSGGSSRRGGGQGENKLQSPSWRRDPSSTFSSRYNTTDRVPLDSRLVSPFPRARK